MRRWRKLTLLGALFSGPASLTCVGSDINTSGDVTDDVDDNNGRRVVDDEDNSVAVRFIHPEPGDSWASQMRVTLAVDVTEVRNIK